MHGGRSVGHSKNHPLANSNHNSAAAHAIEFSENSSKTASQAENVENIDHILDNMFVQRAPHYPPTTSLPVAVHKNVAPTNADPSKASPPSAETNPKSGDASVDAKGESNSNASDPKGSTNSYGDVDVYVAVSR